MTDFAKHLKTLAEPWIAGDRTKSAIDRAARLAGLTYTRTWDIWYGKARRIEYHEAMSILRAVKQKSIEGQQNAVQRLQSEIVKWKSDLAQANADLDREEFDRMRRGHGELGRDYGDLDSAMAKR